MDLVSSISNWSLRHLESSLLPAQGGVIARTACYGYQFFKFGAFVPIAAATSFFSFVLSCLLRPADSPLVAFAKHPQWSDKSTRKAPVPIGFASADFQENGPKEHLKTNWGDYYEKNKEQLGPLDHFPDIWNHPERVIDRLEELGIKNYRFSISRDKIEPTPGEFNQSALHHYRSFCRELRRRGIEPMVTLHHFSDPLYFSWERPQDIDGFVHYCDVVCEALYKEGVRKIVTINEPTVIAFQGWVMGEFPPHHTIDFEGAAKVLETMLRAHTRVYETLKAKYEDLEIGLTHDPIRFRHYHKFHPLWTPIEKILCHYLTEINHNVLMRFFKTGTFSLQVPFRVNHTFQLPSKPPLDFIGLQYYTDPLLQLSLTSGASVAREPDQILTSYQYRTYPQGLTSILEELGELGVPVEITEIGIDTGIDAQGNDQARIRYFDRVFQAVQKALDHGINVRSLYFWSLIDNLEWYKAFAIRFGFYKFDSETGEITPRPASRWLRDVVSR